MNYLIVFSMIFFATSTAFASNMVGWMGKISPEGPVYRSIGYQGWVGAEPPNNGCHMTANGLFTVTQNSGWVRCQKVSFRSVPVALPGDFVTSAPSGDCTFRLIVFPGHPQGAYRGSYPRGMQGGASVPTFIGFEQEYTRTSSRCREDLGSYGVTWASGEFYTGIFGFRYYTEEDAQKADPYYSVPEYSVSLCFTSSVGERCTNGSSSSLTPDPEPLPVCSISPEADTIDYGVLGANDINGALRSLSFNYTCDQTATVSLSILNSEGTDGSAVISLDPNIKLHACFGNLPNCNNSSYKMEGTVGSVFLQTKLVSNAGISGGDYSAPIIILGSYM